jgi:hypothetical protein
MGKILNYLRPEYLDGSGCYWKICPVIVRYKRKSGGAFMPIRFRGKTILRLSTASITEKPSHWQIGWIETA